MADAPTLVDVSNILTYVAPGFVASQAYAHPYSRPEKEHLSVLVVAVAASLPIVAVVNDLAEKIGVKKNPTQSAYVFLLLGVALVVGFVLRQLRDSELAVGRFRLPPRGTVLSTRLLRNLPDESSAVTIALKDGRALSGTPQSGTGDPDSPARELYVRYPRWWDADAGEGGDWTEAAPHGGVIVNLDDVECISLLDDPKA